jgi:hypothetical protein
VDVENTTVVVYYTAKGRGKVGIPTIDPEHGLIGYPSYTNFGIDFRCIYAPTLRKGGQVQIRSALPGAQSSNPSFGANASANGLWNIYGLSHSLDSQIPNGLWESTVQATRTGYPQPIVPKA